MSQVQNSIQNDIPAVRLGHGFNHSFNMDYEGAGLTSATNNIRHWTLPSAFANDHVGVAMRIAHANLELLAVGTGATGGAWGFTLVDSTTGITIATFSIAYNASVLSQSLDCRIAGKNGLVGQPVYNTPNSIANPTSFTGDTIVLNLTAVPTGTLSGGLTSLALSISGEVYGIEC